MATINQLRLPPIRDDDRFEQFCVEMWSTIWDDPSAARHGRSGQSQCGVDVYGLPSYDDKHHGVQAKAVGEPLTDAQIQHEVDEAKKFEPPLGKLTIATTAARDAKGQKYVRAIDLKHKKSGLLRVELLGWEDIQELIQKHLATARPDVIETYFEITVTSSVIGRVLDEVLNTASPTERSVQTLLRGATDLAPDRTMSLEYHADLDYAKKLVDLNQPSQALAYLGACRERFWSVAPAAVRFRILHYTGIARYKLWDMEAAGAAFVEALQYSPEEETALTFGALGHLLLGDRRAAGVVAAAAIAKNPASAKAHAIKIASAAEDAASDQLTADVPTALLTNSEVANALGQHSRANGNLAEAEKWLRVAIAHDKDAWSEFSASLGEVVLSQAAGGTMDPAIFQLTPERARRLTEAEQLLTSAWDGLQGTETQAHRWHWLANRSLARLLLGNRSGAASDLEELRKLQPDNADFLHRRAEIAAQSGDFSLVANLIQYAPAPATVTDRLIRAELLLRSGHAPLAAEQLRPVLDEAAGGDILLNARRLALEAALDTKDLPSAEHIYASILKDDSTSASTLLQGYRVAVLKGDSQSADLLDQATAAITEGGMDTLRCAIASELVDAGRPEDAAKLYEPIADRKANNPVTRSLVRCYYDAGLLAKALELALSLVAEYGPLPMVSEIAAAIYEEAGDLTEARRVADEYLAFHPGDTSMKLRLAFVLLRSGDLDGVDVILSGVRDAKDMEFAQGSRVARLYAHRGRLFEALDISYELRRRFPDESDAHLLLMGLVLNAKPASDPDPLMPTEVGLDSAVRYRAKGDPSEWLIIEERNDCRPPGEQTPGGPIASRLIGRAVGDSVTFGEAPAEESVVVEEILSKYVHAVRESMRTFPRQFPESRALWRFNLELKDESLGTHDIKPFFDMVDKQHARGAEVESIYRSGQIPIGFAAKLLGGDIIGIFGRSVSDPTLGIRSTGGSKDEWDDAQGVIAGRPKLIMDPISLLTLYGLDIRDELAEAFGPFGAPQTLLDWLNQQLLDLEVKPADSYMVVGKQDGEYVRQEVTGEDVRRQSDFVRAIIAWMRRNCEILPVKAAIERGRAFRGRFEEFLHPAFADSMLLATDPGSALYSDDAALRLLSASELETRGVWTQPLLLAAKERGAISAQQYADATIRLTLSNYRHTHIDAEIVLAAAVKSKWSPVPPFTTVIDTLSGAMADEASSIGVAINVIYGIWMEPLLDHQRILLLDTILGRLSSGRNALEVASRVLTGLRLRFRLHPLGFVAVANCVKAWLSQRLA